jgi:CRP-like cAMP-binding protein
MPSAYAQLLAQTTMFEHLKAEPLERLAALLQDRRFSKGEIIFHQGDVGTALYIVRKGEVAIRLSSPEGKEVILSLLGRGDAFGELSLLDGESRSTDAVAREETHLLFLQRDVFRQFVAEHPEFTMDLLAVLSRMVRRVTQLVHDTAFLDARARLARVLLDLAKTQGAVSPEGTVIGPKLTQGELANLCGVTRESVNKWLRFYVREGLLSYESGQITLVDPERLSLDVP